MDHARPPLGFEGARIYEAPSTDRGRLGGHLVRLSLLRDVFTSQEQAFGEDMPDSDRVSALVEEFMSDQYKTDRYAGHNDRILKYYQRFGPKKGDGEVDRVALALHDIVPHAILHPEETALKMKPELEPGSDQAAEAAADIKSRAMETFEKILNRVHDQDGLMKAYLFAIDAAKWESAGRVWREGATRRIEALVTDGKIDIYEGVVLNAAVNKRRLDSIDKGELARVLKKTGSSLVDLRLDDITMGSIKHNVRGLFFKALETIDVIKHPPPDNPASTYRDCIEAISFFAPALGMHGYKELASELRGTALEWLFDDPNGDAERQHTMSLRHFNPVRNIVIGLQEEAFGDVELEDIEYRVKTEGSLREKLAKEKYEGIQQAPDGIGFAFIVPDKMTSEEMLHFAQSYMGRLSWGPHRIVARHPIDAEPAFERIKKKNGYEAINLAFYYHPKDGSGDAVPFEIQVLTKTQNIMKTYGQWSDWYYKNRTEFTPSHQPHLDHMAKRGEAERELAPASTIQSIAEEISETPEMPSFAFNKLFRAVNVDGRLILVPAMLEKKAAELADMLADGLGEPGDLTVLPAAHASENQFEEALSLLGLDVNKDKNIKNALERVKREASNKRADGKTSVLEGHLLPTALAALMLAVQSGRIWDSDKLGPDEYMSNIVTITLLHDDIEAELEKIKDKDSNVILQKRQEILYEIEQMFGTDIMGGVDAMTLPMHIKNRHERRSQYSKNIRANGYARIIKPVDRWQNHLTDLIKLATATRKKPVSASTYKQIMEYFAKTDLYQSADFTSPELPGAYTRVHDVIWRLAKHYGYEPETNND